MKALLVDDDPAVTDYLQIKLAARYDVVVVNDPTTVAAVASQERPDVIVCDVDMPEMDGGAVCRALADRADTRDIPFLYLTSLVPRAESAEREGTIGGRPCVSKHAPIGDILARIRALVGA